MKTENAMPSALMGAIEAHFECLNANAEALKNRQQSALREELLSAEPTESDISTTRLALLACGSTTAFLVAAASVLSEMGDLKASMMLLELSESMASHEAETH